MNVIRLRVVADNNLTRTATLRWPDGSTINVHYPSSVGSPQDYGWNEAATGWAWCYLVKRVPWIFAFDIT